MASSSTGQKQPKWNSELFANSAKHFVPQLVMNSARQDKPVQNTTTISTGQGTNPTQTSTPSAPAVSSEPAALKERIETQTDWKTTKGPKFIMLTKEHAADVPEKYKTASESTQWEVCHEQIQRCIEFIQNDCKQHQVLLVCSGSLGRDIVPKIHDLPQVYAIYVFCMNVDLHKQWTVKHAKIRVVCDDDQMDLLPQLAFDSAYCYYEYSCALVKQGEKELAKKKLEKAVKLLETQTKGRHDQKIESEVRKKLGEC